jgi:HSP20 family molecular chaperone IbpA
MSTTLQNVGKSSAKPMAGSERAGTRRVFRPKVDILETEKNLLLVADMPGVDEQSAEISVNKNVLTLKGTVNWRPPVSHEPLHLEFEVGDFERVFTLSDEVDTGHIQARIKNGQLHLVLPKATPPEARKINVKAG